MATARDDRYGNSKGRSIWQQQGTIDMATGRSLGQSRHMAGLLFNQKHTTTTQSRSLWQPRQHPRDDRFNPDTTTTRGTIALTQAPPPPSRTIVTGNGTIALTTRGHQSRQNQGRSLCSTQAGKPQDDRFNPDTTTRGRSL